MTMMYYMEHCYSEHCWTLQRSVVDSRVCVTESMNASAALTIRVPSLYPYNLSKRSSVHYLDLRVNLHLKYCVTIDFNHFILNNFNLVPRAFCLRG